jgi:hypothetical protein
MASWRKLLVFSAFLPGLAAAADPAMLELIMPDAQVVMEVNLDRIASSPIGQAVTAQMKNELQNMRATWQQPLINFSELDWGKFAQEVIIASSRPGKDAPTLAIVRGLLDPAWIESLQAFHGTKSDYQGVPLLSSTDGKGVIAFLDGGIAVIGQAADVKAAIRRRGQNTPPSPTLAEGLDRFEGQYDIWMVSSGGAAPPPTKPVAGVSLKWMEQVEGFSGGVRFSPDFEISADIAMRSEKDVAGMADSLKWLLFVGQSQGRTVSSLDDMKLQVEGKRLTFKLRVPEQQILGALRQRQTGQRAPLRTAAAPPPEVSNGLPDPPSGTIRVQSSPTDMGTAIVPVEKKP